MIEKNYIVTNENGITVKVAEDLVDFVSTFDCDIFLTHNEAQINMKSIMGFISLIIKAGSKIKLVLSGMDEVEAADKIDKYTKERELVNKRCAL